MMNVPTVLAEDWDTLAEAETALRVSENSIDLTTGTFPAEQFSDRNFSISDPFPSF